MALTGFRVQRTGDEDSLDLSDFVANQRAFMAGSGRLSLAVAGNVRATLRNTSSDRKLHLFQVTSFGTSAWWASLYINPSLGLPESAGRPHLNFIAGGPSGLGEIKVDTSATTVLAGGLSTGIVIAGQSNTREEIKYPMVLMPGVTLGINIPFAGAADTSVTVAWGESDL